MFDIVVAADLDWGIGKTNDLPWPRLSGELKRFKAMTSTASTGKQNAIIMGRKTWDSIGKPLPKRVNLVVSNKPCPYTGTVPPDTTLITAPGFQAALDWANSSPGAASIENTYVIGGGEIYRQALAHPDLRYIYLTRVDGQFNCDVTIPDLNTWPGMFKNDTWDGEASAEENGVAYRFERWARLPGVF